MKMSDALETAFSAQITLELRASIVYRQLAIDMGKLDLPGVSAWLRHQADEEIVHANKFIDHASDRDNRPVIGTIDGPDAEPVSSVLRCFELALQHEQKVSASIRELYRTAESEGDLDSRPLLDWFLAEQIEEESTVDAIIGRLKRIDDDGPGLLHLDEELSRRGNVSAGA
ncbi:MULTISPECIES: ferritin [Allobranchiibius]|uniref:Ferritin n=1 Tax=Allobranchiibius huperziae TaxID=1874116 RepID=A0A853DCK6_9MICO|nr:MULTISPECIES: ferritin [Allobranchiibius]MBO1768443.1 ferritin [Allobranchiibius sp. GilTou38]NYJ73729.1 ferritin [Allobranchiibius huperziae]